MQEDGTIFAAYGRTADIKACLARADYTEIGFGSSGGWSSPEACAYAVGSDIQNYCWETERGMPDPDETRADIEGES